MNQKQSTNQRNFEFSRETEHGRYQILTDRRHPSLKKAIFRYTEENYDKLVEPENVIVTSGAKQAIYNILYALLNPQDEVIVLAPYWVSYPEIIKMGFDGVVENSLDAVGSRDFALEALSVFSFIALGLSRMAQYMIFYSAADVGLIEMPDEFTSTSSIMPQKKNPDPLEVLRARCSNLCTAGRELVFRDEPIDHVDPYSYSWICGLIP